MFTSCICCILPHPSCFFTRTCVWMWKEVGGRRKRWDSGVGHKQRSACGHMERKRKRARSGMAPEDERGGVCR